MRIVVPSPPSGLAPSPPKQHCPGSWLSPPLHIRTPDHTPPGTAPFSRSTHPEPGWAPDLVDCAKSSGSKNFHLPQLCLFQDSHLSLVGHRSTGRQWLHQLGEEVVGQCWDWAADPRLAGRSSACLTSVSCSSLRIVYFRIFCRLRLIRIPKTSPMTMNSRMPTTAAMMDVTGLETEARVRDWEASLGQGV